MRKKIIFIILSAFVFFTGCQKKSATTAGKDASLIRVKTAKTIRKDMSETLTIFGKLSLRQESFLASQFDGRLADFSLLLGDRVNKGEQIGMIIPAAREAILQVLATMPQDQRNLLEQQIKSIPLYSPITGCVLEVMRHTGDVLQAGESIVHIGDLSTLDVRGDLPVQFLPVIHTSQKLNVEFIDFPHPPLQLPIDAISGKINPDNQTVVVRLKCPNPRGEFRPGMLVNLSFPSQIQKDVIAVPRQAILEDEGLFSVFVLQGNKVEKRQVMPGIFSDEWVEIKSGLRENEEIVTEKAYSLEDGLEVQVE